jgi:superfamily II DNA or RNA helicase
MNNQEKGLLYEKFIKDIIINNLGKNAYLWNECPENILIENNLINSHNELRILRKDLKEGHLHNHKDIGIDIIQINEQSISIIQAKNGYENGLCVNDISGIMMRSAFSKLQTFIYYTSFLSRNIKYTSNNSSYVFNKNNIEELLEISNDNNIYFVKIPYNKIEENIIKIEYKPYSYQIEAFNKFNEHFINNNRGILSLPCGCGKTYTSYLISEKYSQIILISPLREFASQNLNRFIEYGYNKLNTLLIDTDGERNIDNIKKFINKNKNFLISTTYKSVDLIKECLNLFKNPLIIIDEFHNLSKINITDKTNDIYKLLKSNHKILFMSATPRIYDIENDEEEEYFIEDMFGKIVYEINFRNAISNKYITDYKIWLPSIHENNEELDKELSIYDIDNEIKNRCKYLYSCILNNGSRKIIIYCKDTNDMNNMIECMKTLNDYYIINMDLYGINSETNDKNRKEILENFSNNNKIQLLFNIRILNECIDIPKCDSIYISYPPKNKITTIQRINRATRIDKNNPYKIANIYIWCNEYEEILETLSSIKEYDILFKDKVKINSIDFFNNKTENDFKILQDDIKICNDYIIRIKEYKQYTWEDKLKIIQEYIIREGKRPSSRDKNKTISSYARWICRQEQKYKEHKQLMKNENIRKIWEDFIKDNKELFNSNEEIWLNRFNLIKIYIKENKKLPSRDNKNKEIKSYGIFINHNMTNYKNNQKNMKNENIRRIWEEFVKDNKELFNSNEENWLNKINLIKIYIKENKKLPSRDNENKEISSLAIFLRDVKQNYKRNEYIMKNENIRRIWEEFVKEYL